MAETLEFLRDFYSLPRYPIKRFGKVYRPKDLINKELAKTEKVLVTRHGIFNLRKLARVKVRNSS